ncbi:unnamed protein product [Danaus chrysippus]|uniref:(African queen) hypothetical protein n=1 Tax=Danaus chrysippus TaxID=151541 RepID=A0A8J2QKV8_9NEOP|nr:unnamed protein product [Danaus chrysippus]
MFKVSPLIKQSSMALEAGVHRLLDLLGHSLIKREALGSEKFYKQSTKKRLGQRGAATANSEDEDRLWTNENLS